MAKSKKGGGRSALKTLPVDLSALAGAPLDAIKSTAYVAAIKGVKAFDAGADAVSVFSGRRDAPMKDRVRVTKDGVTIRLHVSPRPVRISALRVSPSLSVSTTGKARRPVKAQGLKEGRVVEIPRGFIWNGSIFMRNEKKRGIVSAKSYLVSAGVEISPALVLGRVADDVTKSVMQALTGAVDGTR